VCFIGAYLARTREKIPFNGTVVMIALAGVCLVMNWVFLFKSFQVSSITIGNISYYLQPIILIILGIFIYKEKVGLQQWMLILLALTGVLLTIDVNNLSSSHVMLGVFYALFAALLYSFLTILMKPVNLSYLKIIFIQLFIGVIMLIPFIHFQKLGAVAISCLIVIGVVHTLFAYYLYYQAIKEASFTQIAIVSYLDPIVAIATDIIFFNRHLNLYQMAGVGLTFIALYLLVVASRPAEVVA
jgi:drug/metabolite transporter (DMT)-like permease